MKILDELAYFDVVILDYLSLRSLEPYFSGKVLEHCRRSFSAVKSISEVKLHVMLWALKSMKSLRKKKG